MPCRRPGGGLPLQPADHAAVELSWDVLAAYGDDVLTKHLVWGEGHWPLPPFFFFFVPLFLGYRWCVCVWVGRWGGMFSRVDCIRGHGVMLLVLVLVWWPASLLGGAGAASGGHDVPKARSWRVLSESDGFATSVAENLIGGQHCVDSRHRFRQAWPIG